MRKAQPDAVISYIRDLYAKEDALLEEIVSTLQSRTMAIQIGAEEGRLLQLLIRMNQVKSIVEVGTLAGYSTLWMARALPEDGMIYTIEREKAHFDLAVDFFKRSEVGGHIQAIHKEATEGLRMLEDKAPFDMMFIDADKIHYDVYLDWADLHVRPGGLIIIDNSLLFGSVYQDAPTKGVRPTTWQVMKKVNERLADQTRYDAIMLPTKEGLSIAVKK